MKHLSLLSVFFFVFSPALLVAQTPELDSLQTILNSTTVDSSRLTMLLEVTGKMWRHDPDKTLEYAQEAIDLAQELDRPIDLGYAQKNIGLSYYIKSEYAQVSEYWKASLATFEKVQHKKGISNLLSNLGALHYSQGDFSEALTYYNESLVIAEKENDLQRRSTLYMNIGAVYAENKDTYDDAKEIYLEALEIAEQNKLEDAIATTSLNLGELFLKEGYLIDVQQGQKEKGQQALNYFNKALSSFEKIGGNKGETLKCIGEAYAMLGDNRRALEELNKGLLIAREDQSILEESAVLVELGNAYYREKEYGSAEKNYLQAIERADTYDGKQQKLEAYDGLSDLYEKMKKYDQAYIYEKEYSILNDIMRSVENEKTINNLRFINDMEDKEQELERRALQIERDGATQRFLYAIGAFLLIGIIGLLYQYRFTKKTNALLEEERNKSEQILLNILPKETAEELKEKGHVDAKAFEHATVMFTDFVGFTKLSKNIDAAELVKSVDYYFKAFDSIIGKYNLEKIKTIGDSYMCAGGLPAENESNALDAVKAGLEIARFVNDFNKNPEPGIMPFQVRIGINSGNLVAGVVGTKKFQYDIWGNTVNVAARMESACEPGMVNISESTYEQIQTYFECKYRGEIDIKNAGKRKMYYALSSIV